MKIAIYAAFAVAAFALLALWLVTQIHYRIGSRHLKITVLGVPLRRISLNNIKYVSKRQPKGLAERWHNTFKTTHRLLTIQLERGVRKYICITPRNRYVFLADLRSAVRRVNPDCDWAKRQKTVLLMEAQAQGAKPPESDLDTDFFEESEDSPADQTRSAPPTASQAPLSGQSR